jgi:hypothetical protein
MLFAVLPAAGPDAIVRRLAFAVLIQVKRKGERRGNSASGWTTQLHLPSHRPDYSFADRIGLGTAEG